ncbi:MAG: hypothetical protein AB1563_09010, partial [Bacillota bacterium]
RGDAYRHAIKLEVVLKDGRVLEDYRESAKGSPAHPLSREEIEAKFFKLAGKVLDHPTAQKLRDLIYRVDTLEDVRALSAALAPSAV